MTCAIACCPSDGWLERKVRQLKRQYYTAMFLAIVFTLVVVILTYLSGLPAWRAAGITICSTLLFFGAFCGMLVDDFE
jgi:hypothetical protein